MRCVQNKWGAGCSTVRVGSEKKEIDANLKALLAARAAQDAKLAGEEPKTAPASTKK